MTENNGYTGPFEDSSLFESGFETSPFTQGPFAPPPPAAGTEALHYNTTQDIEILAKPKYVVSIVPCRGGSDVLSQYRSIKPKKYWYYLIAEPVVKDDKYNFFGTFCLMKMGDAAREKMEALKEKKLVFSATMDGEAYTPPGDANGTGGLRTQDNMALYMQQIYKKKIPGKILDTDTILRAIDSELVLTTPVNSLLSTVLGLNHKLADRCYEYAASIRKNKIKPENYEYKKGKGKFLPLIPIPAGPDGEPPIPGIRDALTGQIQNEWQQLLKLLKSLLSGEGIVPAIVETILDEFSRHFLEIADILDLDDKTISDVRETALVLNALVCGLYDGALGVLEMLVTLLGWICEYVLNTPLEKMSPEHMLYVQNTKEMIEDVAEFLSDTMSSIVSSFKRMISDFDPGEFGRLLSAMGRWFSGQSRYSWAYMAGDAILQIVVGVVLAIVTDGGSLVAEGASVGANLLRIIGREIVSYATMGILDLLTLLRLFFKKLAEVLAKGFKHGIDEIIAFFEKIFAKQEAEANKNLASRAEKAGVPQRNIREVDDLINKTEGIIIRDLQKDPQFLKNVFKALENVTEHSTEVAELYKRNKIIIEIKGDNTFNELLMEKGKFSFKEAVETRAYTFEQKTYYRSSSSVEQFLDDIVHEGMHVKDYHAKLNLSTLESELKALRAEDAYRVETGRAPRFASDEERIQHVKTKYLKRK